MINDSLLFLGSIKPILFPVTPRSTRLHQMTWSPLGAGRLIDGGGMVGYEGRRGAMAHHPPPDVICASGCPLAFWPKSKCLRFPFQKTHIRFISDWFWGFICLLFHFAASPSTLLFCCKIERHKQGRRTMRNILGSASTDFFIEFCGEI